MADRNQLKVDREYEFADSDPLAELTRIMGFDPRIEPAPPLDPDLSIDLERELMGEFEAELTDDSPDAAPEAAPEPAPAAWQAAPVRDQEAAPAVDEGAFDDALAASFEEEFSAAVDEWRPEAEPERADLHSSSPWDSPAPGVSPVGESEEDGEVAIDIDFSGQLSPADDEEATEAGERFLQEHAAADEVPDIELELGELLSELSAPHHWTEDPPTQEADDFPARGGQSQTDDGYLAAAEPVSELQLESSVAGFGSAEEPTSSEASDYEEPEARDEILDQLFQQPVTETVVHDERRDDDFREDPLVVDSVDPEIGPAAESGRGADAPASPPAVEAEMPADLPDFNFADEHIAQPEADDQLFDEGEFEAALFDELSPVDEPAADSHETALLSADFDREPGGEAAIEAEPSAGDPFPDLALADLPPPEDAQGDEYQQDGKVEYAHAAAPWTGSAASSADAAGPEIDTVEILEMAVALPDDLDLPEVRLESEPPKPVSFDDFEADFASAFDDAGHSADHGSAEPDQDYFSETSDLEADLARIFDAEEGTYVGQHDEHDAHATDADYAAGGQHYGGEGGGLVYDPAYDAEMDDAPQPSDGRPGRNRGVVAVAVVAGLALASGVGAFALSFGGGEDGAPALVRADDGPVKVKPANPGGVVVPNQDNKVYERVTEGVLDAPSQKTLISSAEEPVEIAAPVAAPAQSSEAAQALPGVDLNPIDPASGDDQLAGKAEDRIEPTDIESVIANDQIAAVTPRRVRTMVVRPDGTLAPREEEEPAPAAQPEAGADASAPDAQAATAAPALDPISQPQAAPAVQPAVLDDVTAPVEASPTVLPDETATAQPIDVATASAPATQGEAQTPASIPVAPPRPVDQPLEIVGQVAAREKMAALSQPEAVAEAGGWSVQISSQASAEAAQATYVNLARKYGSVLEGRSFNIVKADIAGKGTFWRVRIPAGSRSDAIDLCERYKAAGGSCFVSQ